MQTAGISVSNLSAALLAVAADYGILGQVACRFTDI
jgi:hypothetical protein